VAQIWAMAKKQFSDQLQELTSFILSAILSLGSMEVVLVLFACEAVA
jgi:hypothetical protein